MSLFKVLNEDGTAIYGRGKWYLPRGRPGKWMPRIKNLEPCISGYHMIESPEGLVRWLGPAIWIAEGDGKRIEKEPGVGIYERARLISRVKTWDERTARLFAADCAGRVLSIFEKMYPKDKRPRKAIQAARNYANGKINAAARAAAWAAARDAAGAAAGAAAWAAARDAAGDAAWAAAGDAAGAAARDAAWDAAWDAARDAELKWQAERLVQYLRGGLK